MSLKEGLVMAAKTIDITYCFAARVHPTEESGYWVEVPALLGYVTEADTLAQLRRNPRVALDLYLVDRG
jgi:predicted RNase H-like HicB family nuclease